ncbi:MAG TPA: Mur ligase family protein [Tenuifilaceae bacterium]|nr:Mur ligase family protein [Tenuifilaceae bacterium]
MKIHFIAIGGSAMHNLAIALKQKGYEVTGSDDEFFEPSLSRLKQHGLLPSEIGWYPERLTPDIDAVVLGMHASSENPELQKARVLGLKIYSYPEYLYEQTRGKTRVVIGGSHGKTTITSMVMHVLQQAGFDFDYMVGAQLEGFDNMVGLNNQTNLAVFEGDEYLTSPVDPRPKFHLYKPTIAVISGIAWDHFNVFPTIENYRDQFVGFISCIEPNGTLVYCSEDDEVAGVVSSTKRSDLELIPYTTHPYRIEPNVGCQLVTEQACYPLKIFGRHNMQNISAAKAVCLKLGVSESNFYRAISTFKGAAKRLQRLAEGANSTVFIDFAHSPSKVAATIGAVLEEYPNRKLVACLELHTFSSLNINFMSQYRNVFSGVAVPIVYFDPVTVEHKNLPPLNINEVRDAFGQPIPDVCISASEMVEKLNGMNWENANLLLMTSGNFSGLNLNGLALQIAR